MKNTGKKVLSMILAAAMLTLCSCQKQPEYHSTRTAGEAEKSDPEAVQGTEALTGPDTEASETFAAAPQPVSVAVQTETQEKKVLWTGDSRSVCVYCSQVYDEAEFPKHIFYNIDEGNFTGILPESVFVAKGGMDFPWMERTGMPLLFLHLADAKAIVVWFGVNDLHNIGSYIRYMNTLVTQCSIPMYYLTIGPAEGSWAGKNEEIQSFNQALSEQLSPDITVIDTCSFLAEGLRDGRFATMDGLHYNYQTSRAVYDYVMSQIP